MELASQQFFWDVSPRTTCNAALCNILFLPLTILSDKQRVDKFSTPGWSPKFTDGCKTCVPEAVRTIGWPGIKKSVNLSHFITDNSPSLFSYQKSFSCIYSLVYNYSINKNYISHKNNTLPKVILKYLQLFYYIQTFH